MPHTIVIPEQPIEGKGFRIHIPNIAGAEVEGEYVVVFAIEQNGQPRTPLYISVKDALYIREAITPIVDYFATNPMNLPSKKS